MLGEKFWKLLGRIGLCVSLIYATIRTVSYAFEQIAAPLAPDVIAGRERMIYAAVLGGAAAFSYGALWSIANQIARWDYGEGSEGELPPGWEAVVLSLWECQKFCVRGLCEGFAGSADWMANWPIAAVHATGRRQWMPAFLTAR